MVEVTTTKSGTLCLQGINLTIKNNLLLKLVNYKLFLLDL